MSITTTTRTEKAMTPRRGKRSLTRWGSFARSTAQTSKTSAEIEMHQKKLRNRHSFIEEIAGVIFIQQQYF